MLATERDYYLANVLLLSPPERSPEQVRHIDGICAAIEADAATVQRAQQLLEQGKYRPKPVGRYSERIRNLEDMLLMVMLGGSENPRHKAELLSFARQLGVNQQQLQWMVEESREYVESKSSLFKSCVRCEQRIPQHSDYCPSCGACQLPLLEQNTQNGVRLKELLPQRGLVLLLRVDELGPDVLQLAQFAPEHDQFQIGSKEYLCLNWSEEQVCKAMPLAQAIEKQKLKVKVYWHGQAASWEDVFAFLACWQKRQHAYQPPAHCFGLDDWGLNIWGCKQLRMDWEAGQEWFSYGYFDSSTVFVFDKPRIRHAIQQQMSGYRFCPHFDEQHIDKVLEALPNKILVTEESQWRYLETEKEVPGALRIPHRSGQGSLKPQFAIGVQPTDFSEAARLLRRIKPDLNLPQLNPPPRRT